MAGEHAKGDPCISAGAPDHGAFLATDKQKAKLENLFKAPEYEPVHLVWSVYQKMVDAYR